MSIRENFMIGANLWHSIKEHGCSLFPLEPKMWLAKEEWVEINDILESAGLWMATEGGIAAG